MARTDQGTWMGVTKQGRIAILTNWHETTTPRAVGVCSRGAIVNSFLTLPPQSETSTRQFVSETVSGTITKNVGGFSLVCGKVNEPLAILSNRASDIDNMVWIAREKGETTALSNTTLGNRSWPKIVRGEQLTCEAIKAHAEAGEGEEDLIHRLLDVLSRDTLPRLEAGTEAEAYFELLQNTIFVPVVGYREGVEEEAAGGVGAGTVCETGVVSPNRGSGQPGQAAFISGEFGTQKQTILLVGANGRVRYFERTLFDDDAKAVPIGEGDRSFEFMIDQTIE
jgi:uncharacterized protein with NRDE domain